MNKTQAASAALEQWLLRRLGPGSQPLPSGRGAAATRPTSELASARLEAWLQARLLRRQPRWHEHGQGGPPETLSGDGEASGNAQPGQSHVAGGQARGFERAPVDGPPVAGFDPLKPQQELTEPEEQARYVLPLELDLYAQIQVAAVEQDDSLEKVLSSHDLDRGIWTDHLRRQRDALDKEHAKGQTQLAEAIERALEEARGQAATRKSKAKDLCSMENYALVRAQLERGVPLQDALDTIGAEREQWQNWSKTWMKQSRSNAKVSKEIRQAIAKARRQKGS